MFENLWNSLVSCRGKLISIVVQIRFIKVLVRYRDSVYQSTTRLAGIGQFRFYCSLWCQHSQQQKERLKKKKTIPVSIQIIPMPVLMFGHNGTDMSTSLVFIQLIIKIEYKKWILSECNSVFNENHAGIQRKHKNN